MKKQYLFTILSYIIILLWGGENVSSSSLQDLQDYEIYNYDNYDLRHQAEFGEGKLYLVTILGLLLSTINSFGSLYIFYQTFVKLRNSVDLSLPTSTRFPFYIAITDFGFSITYIINIAYTLIHKRTLPNPNCIIIGISMVSFIVLNLLLIGIMAMTTWLRVVREVHNNFGRFDYKLWGVLIASTLIFDIICRNDFGANRYWCSTKLGTVTTPAIFTCLVVIVLIIILSSYLHVLHIIRELENNGDDDNNNLSNHNTSNLTNIDNKYIEHKVTLKIFQYVLVFLLQYIPFLVYGISRLLKTEHFIIYVILVNGFNIGGIGNLYQYIKLEGSNPPVSTDLTDLTVLNEVPPSSSSFDSSQQNQTKITIND